MAPQWRLASCLFVDEPLDEDAVPRLFADGPNIAGLLHSAANRHAIVDVLDSFHRADANSASSSSSSSSSASSAASASSSASSATRGPSVPLDKIVFALHARSVMQASHLYPALGVNAARLASSSTSASSSSASSSSSSSSTSTAAALTAAERARWGGHSLGAHDVLLLNSGRPSVSHAIVRGDARVYDPVSLADALRQIGGMRVLLPLFERRLTGEALRKSLILVQLLLRDSPKVHTAREGGDAIIASGRVAET